MIQPKPPKVDLERLMLYHGEILRFECKMMKLGSMSKDIFRISPLSTMDGASVHGRLFTAEEW